MSHVTGTVQTLTPAIDLGPNTGAPPTSPNTWALDFEPAAAPMGTKFVILHFQNVSLPGSSRLEVDLGYDTDVFTAADGEQFWTRPANVYVLPGGKVPIRYIQVGAGAGGVQLDRYGRGERHIGTPGHPSFSNCDPFLGDPVYVEPTYDPFWYCAEPPNWENVACAPADVRAQVARGVGMIVTIHGNEVSTCSATLVDADKVITAGHCHSTEEALSASVTFDYQTECGGARPPGYNARFFKVTAVLKHKWNGIQDYSLLQLKTAPPGVPVVQLRHDVPAPGEQVFGVHHPNGAVKKLSIPHPGFATVLSSNLTRITVGSEFDVSGGSSGSGLFDLAGRIVGILSHGDPCGRTGVASDLRYFPIAGFLADTAPAPPPPITRDVMLVVDRSGSMVENDGTGRTKIEVARDAVSLFVQLVQAGTGNRIGLVSFSSNDTTDFGIASVTNANKNTLIGPAPYSGGKVGALTPGGMTSIGEGLDAARAQFPAPGANPRSILLLTDGLQNTPRMIHEVEGALGDISVNAIGLGSESNLDGPLLSALTAAHGGMYMRAGNGLALEKFFTQAFGNIFETGILFDPEVDLPAGSDGAPMTFNICGETALTAVVGWDRTDANLVLELTSPGGAVIHPTTSGVVTATGRSWTFLRLNLPHGGERDGAWKVRVRRPGGGGEFPPPTPALRYFLSVVPAGGPRLLRAGETRRRYYTGDALNPLVMLRYDDGGWPHHADVQLTITRPDQGTGNILTASGLGGPETKNGDVLPARYAKLQALEAASGKPVVNYVESTLALRGDSYGTGGFFEAGGIYGLPMSDVLTVEGSYTFHARASYGHECKGSRELVWSAAVEVGIDPDHTVVTTDPIGPGPDGSHCYRVTMTPRDRYGNHLGPGRADAFTLQAQPGTTVNGAPRDLGNGSYSFEICWDPASGEPPGVGVVQPDRPAVVVPVSDIRLFSYSVTFLCGEQPDCPCECTSVRPGRYATEVNIHNYHQERAPLIKLVTPLVLAGAVRGREPKSVAFSATDRLILPPHSASMDDCCRLLELLLGAAPSGPVPLTLGVLQIVSTVELAVSAVYTVADPAGGSTSIDVEEIPARLMTLGRGAAALVKDAGRPPAPPAHDHSAHGH